LSSLKAQIAFAKSLEIKPELAIPQRVAAILEFWNKMGG
jgi:hypothetical protein